MSEHKIVIGIEDDGCRIDKWLKTKYQVPYTLIQKLFRKHDIFINDIRADSKYFLKKDDVVKCYGINLNEKKDLTEISDQDFNEMLKKIKESIIFQDSNLLIINKPYSIAVQNGSKIALSIDTILPNLCENTKCRLVHRLDRYTTGVLVVAKSKEASTDLIELFKEHEVSKQYLAVLVGVPQKKEGIIKSKIKKSVTEEKEKVFSDEDGKEAITKFKVLSVSKDKKLSLVQFSPITGRTHQIRVHASEELECAILGDGKYKLESSQNNIKMHLHAHTIQFSLNGKNYRATAPLPEHIRGTLQKNGLYL